MFFNFCQISDSWFKLEPENVYFVTDTFDPVLNKTVNGNLISTNCDNDYNIDSSGCKLNYELRHMLQKNAMWSCHFNDDTYVNIPILKQKLENLNHELPYYVGTTVNQMPIIVNGEIFWYAKSGACISRKALEKISAKIISHEFYTDYIKHDKMAGEVALGYMMSKFRGSD
uniref:Uncharacterized protein n=1 Tax=Panagrolaimus sp. PS1159 TaxID=55785 RepID=A0AC35FUH4_9BILA